ncbi:cation/H(+) antiporter 15-like [Magnolia sinica]|uniref:cation/H(+) antiporter 15-like n=1 Tax=Magnolia sinica TaxID=86752 RepID=UPI002657FB56|nr:cation/H(+) antiporter 15-like [Magnolia sinica]
MSSNGLLAGESPFNYVIPLFIIQLTIIVITTRTLGFLLKPLRQPPVIYDILGGVLLGPSVMGQSQAYASLFFPLWSVSVLETVANLGLVLFLFIVGVEMDLSMLWGIGRKSMAVAFSGMILPFLISTVISFFINYTDIHQGSFLLFLGIALSVTAFPVLARLLTELKLLNTDLGRIAMSSAVINDLMAWVLLALAIALTNSKSQIFASLWVILSGVFYVFFCIFVVRPIIMWIIRQTLEGETIDEIYLSFIIASIFISSIITDSVGINAFFGPFVFGLVIPNGSLGALLIERLEDIVHGMLLPIFFVISGLRTNVLLITNFWMAGVLILVISAACAGKVLGTLLIARFYGMPVREGLSLGVLMNAKGLVEMIILNVGRNQKVIDDQSFAIIVLMAVIVTSSITPLVTIIYRPARLSLPYKRRTIQHTKSDKELRMLVCMHNEDSVPTILRLLESSHPTRRSPMSVYALHLVELTGRASTMLITHNIRTNRSTKSKTDQIINAFENYRQKLVGVSVQVLTVASPYPTMHEDICGLAEEKRAALIVLPFHKQKTVDGRMEARNPAFQTINTNVLMNSPCSVGILVDGGQSGDNRHSESRVFQNVGVLFFGGADDREGLAYASRMSQHPGISLTVVRFVEGEHVLENVVDPEKEEMDMLSVFTERDKEKQLDNECINVFRHRHLSDESVLYIEKVVNNAEETVEVVRGMDSNHDLFIVGRGQGMLSPLTVGLTDWSDCPELGAMGDLLASIDFAAMASVLVVQQYLGVMSMEGTAMTPDSLGDGSEQLMLNDARRGLVSQTLHQNRSPASIAVRSGMIV